MSVVHLFLGFAMVVLTNEGLERSVMKTLAHQVLVTVCK
jgi:hypothetical protein